MKILIKHILFYFDMVILFDDMFVKFLHYVKGGKREQEGCVRNNPLVIKARPAGTQRKKNKKQKFLLKKNFFLSLKEYINEMVNRMINRFKK